MADADSTKRCEPDDPRRCQAIAAFGQCNMLAIEGASVCNMHGGGRIQKNQQAQELKNYHLTRFHAKVARMSNSDGIKSLRDEIGILRMLLEEQLNQCESVIDMITMSHSISELVMKIERLVITCTKLESSLGQTMDKQALLSFASKIIGIIGDNITDAATLDIISNEILQALSTTSVPEGADPTAG